MAQRYYLKEALMEACENGKSEIALDLISQRANPFYEGVFGTTALHVACRCVYVCAQLVCE